MRFGEKIKVYRILRGLFQEDLVQLSGFGRTVIIRHESEDGEKGPRRKTVEAYSEALRIPKMALGGEEDGARGIQDIFRPINPYRPLLPETLNRIIADLKDLLPKLIADLNLTQAHFFNSDIGSVTSLTGKRHRLILVMPPTQSPLSVEISAVLRKEFTGSQEKSKISENLYIELMLNPVGTLDQKGLPDGLLIHPKSSAAEIYRPPRLITRVSFELAGDRPELCAAIQKFISGFGEHVKLKVDPPVNLRVLLPPEIERWISKHSLSVDKEGRVIEKKERTSEDM
jgi:DNA-binding XRE family transcriptional regulator